MPKGRLIAGIAAVALGVLAVVAPAPTPAQGPASAAEPVAVPEAAEACLMCHDDPGVAAILQTPHAVAADPRSGFAEHGCATCHGPSEAHMRRPPRGGKRAPPDVVFAPGGEQPADAANRACLGCHQGEAALHWQGSRHETEGLACTDCHRAHVAGDPVLDRATQAEVCYACHRRQRAEALQPSAHPMHDGRMACSDCHAAHGSTGPALLDAGTVNETCYRCHAETRGPFLWEHPPAREDCLSCHRPHGSVHAPLLTQRTPWLCQQCHLAQFHPSTALSGTGLPGDTRPSGSQSMLGRDCMNCHVQVHGGNHPSGPGTVR